MLRQAKIKLVVDLRSQVSGVRLKLNILKWL